MNIRWIGLLVTAALVGCDSGPTGDIVDTVPASGTLTFNGKPLEYYQVAIFPQDNRPAIGITDDQGRFTLGTNDENDGAVVGIHGVAITYVGKPSDNPDEGIMEFTPPPPPKVKIPGKYNSAETSGLTVEILSDGTSDLNLDLQ